MKKLAYTVGTIWLLLPVAPLIAGDGQRHDGNATVWIFLGFCALIVVLQLFQAMRRLGGLTRTDASEAATAEQKSE